MATLGAVEGLRTDLVGSCGQSARDLQRSPAIIVDLAVARRAVLRQRIHSTPIVAPKATDFSCATSPKPSMTSRGRASST